MIKKINESLSPNKSLMGGTLGIALAHINDADRRLEIEAIVNDAIDSKFMHNNYTHAYGLTGLYWLLVHLTKLDIIEQQNINDIDFDSVKIFALDCIEKQNFDFFHGSIGVANLFLYGLNEIQSGRDFLWTFIDEFFEKTEHNYYPLVPMEFDFTSKRIKKNVINFGISHGITSSLKVALQCYINGINSNKSLKICLAILDCLNGYINKDISYCYFPNSISLTGAYYDKSRLGWCYGDLTIAYTLYQCGECLADNDLIKLSLKIMTKCSERREFYTTNIFDCGICHGTAGVGYVLKKFSDKTKITSIEDAAAFWITKTNTFIIENFECINSYESFNAIENLWQPDSSLLEGSAGISIVLNSIKENNFSWDSCIMLNEM